MARSAPTGSLEESPASLTAEVLARQLSGAEYVARERHEPIARLW